MGKDNKKYVIIEKLRFNFNNRGNSALCYGAISFLEKFHNLKGHILLNIHPYNNFLKLNNLRSKKEQLNIQGHIYQHYIVPVHRIEYYLFLKTGIRLPFTPFGRAIKQIDYVASDFGGDGFSDIYGVKEFLARMTETNVAIKAGRPLIVLPQTLGPFKSGEMYNIGERVLRYASKIYLRDGKFEDELKKMGLDYELTNDLSAFMVPEPWDISIDTDNAIGLNVSGLAYSGGWKDLKGQFKNYPLLIEKIIAHFRKLGKTIYLIPHSYDFNNPKKNNDDMLACRQVYESLKDKTGIVFVDKNLTAPQVKYVISKMSFFIGTRMHANFAAIFTKVPLFGLAYSYKFEGAFNNNGIYGQTAMINNINETQVNEIVDKIAKVYIDKTTNTNQ